MNKQVIEFYNNGQSKYTIIDWGFSNDIIFDEVMGITPIYEWLFNPKYKVFEVFFPHKVYGGVLENMSKDDSAWTVKEILSYLSKQTGGE